MSKNSHKKMAGPVQLCRHVKNVRKMLEKKINNYDCHDHYSTVYNCILCYANSRHDLDFPL